MAIKLADVIENANSDYPVIDASKDATTGGVIKGFGIFRDFDERDAVPENKRCYGYVAVVLYADQIHNEITSFDSTINTTSASYGTGAPEYDLNADGTYSTADDLAWLGLANTVISNSEGVYGFDTSTRIFVFKTKPYGLDLSSGGSNSVISGAGANVSVSDEDIDSAIGTGDWEDAANWIEIGLGANSYPIVPGETIQNDATDYRLALYDDGTSRIRSMSFENLLGGILQQMIEAITTAGLGTETTYTNPDTGIIGDFNGDGLVGSSDLLIFLGGFGANLGSNTGSLGFDESNYIVSASNLTDPTNAVEMIQVAQGNSDWATAGGPDATDLQNGSTDYQTPFFFSAAQGTPGVGAWDVFESIGATSSDRSFFGFEYAGGVNDPTFQDGIVTIKLTAFTVTAFTRLLGGSHNLGFIFRVRLKNSSGSVLQTKYFSWEVPVPGNAISGSITDSFSVLPPGQDLKLLVNFGDQANFGDTQTGVAPNHVANVTRVEIEYDYYAPDAASAVFYLLQVSATVKCQQP